MRKFLTQIKRLAFAACMAAAAPAALFAQDDIATVRAAAEGEIVTTRGVVTRAKGDMLFVQDQGAAIAVYQDMGRLFNETTEGAIAPGDFVEVRGARDDEGGFQKIVLENGEFTLDSRVTVLTRQNPLPRPQEVSIEELRDNGEMYESELVVARDLTSPFDGQLIPFGTYLVSDGTGAIELRLGNVTDTEVQGRTLPERFAFTGPVGQMGDNYFLAPILSDDISEEGIEEEEFYTLTILHNNDGESRVLANEDGFGGVAAFKAVIDRARMQAQAAGSEVVLVSSGDNFLAGPRFNASLELEEGEPYYDAVALDAFGYDAIALGNHDFDFGPQVLANFINSFDGEDDVFLSANLDFSNEPVLQELEEEGKIAEHVIVEKGGEQIAIIGLTTDRLATISSPGNVTVSSMLAEELAEEVQEAKDAGVNKIILISHLQSLVDDEELAAMMTDIDVVVAGGSDALLANPNNLLLPEDQETGAEGPYPTFFTDATGKEIPFVTTAGEYGYLGRLVVSFDENGEVVAINQGASGPIRVAGGDQPDAVTPDAELQANVADPVQASIDALADNVIAIAVDSLDGIRGNVRTGEANIGNLLADALLWQANENAEDFGAPMAHIAMTNGGGIRNSVTVSPGGEVTELTTFDIAPFGNFVTIVEEVSPETLKQLLERAYSGAPEAEGRFAQIAGFRVNVDTTATAQVLEQDEDENLTGGIATPGERVIDVRLDDGTWIIRGGEIVSDAPSVNIATVDFLARERIPGTGLGGDSWPFRNAAFKSVGTSYQKALFNYIVNELEGEISDDMYPHHSDAQTRINPNHTRVNVIHDASDPSLSVVDVYDPFGELLIDDFEYRTATGVGFFPTGFAIPMGFAPGDSESADDVIATISVELPEGELNDYAALASGVFNAEEFASNPNEREIEFNAVVSNEYSLYNRAGGINAVIVHNVTDAPAVSVRPRGSQFNLVDDLEYTQSVAAALPAEDLVLEVLVGGEVVQAYDAPLSAFAGQSLIVYASGFLNPADNNDGPAFGLFVATVEGGEAIELPIATSLEELAKNGGLGVMAYPNPASNFLNLAVQLAQPSEVSVEFRNAQGQLVRRAHSEGVAGRNTIEIDASEMPAGVYFARVTANGSAQTLKFVIAR